MLLLISVSHSIKKLATLFFRSEGLVLLNELIHQCSTEVFSQHVTTWVRLLTGLLQVEYAKFGVECPQYIDIS